MKLVRKHLFSALRIRIKKRSILKIIWVRSRYIINPAGKIAHLWTKVAVGGHVEDVKAKLKELRGKLFIK